jgi:hypothetical protein
LARLHGDAARKPDRLEQRLQMLREVIAPERGQFIGHPRILGPSITPEVLVGIDLHRPLFTCQLLFGQEARLNQQVLLWNSSKLYRELYRELMTSFPSFDKFGGKDGLRPIARSVRSHSVRIVRIPASGLAGRTTAKETLHSG